MEKKRLPPFWHPSFDFSEVACWPSLCTYCALFVVCFWFVPFERPIGVFALVERLCRRFFGSDLLKGRSPLAFLHLLCVCAEGFLVQIFWKVEAPWRFCTCCAFVLISMQSLRILHTLLTYYFVQHVDACRSLPFGLFRRR